VAVEARLADLLAGLSRLPNARVVVMEGQQHVADILAPEVVAGHLLAFLR
jgi:hypothetical protein